MGTTARVVVIAGATSAAGIATAEALIADEAIVVAIGSNLERLSALKARVPGAHTRLCDLSDLTAVTELAASLHSEFGRVDGLIHLVGGWRGSLGIEGQTDEDWAAMAAGFTTLRNTTRAFHEHLLSSQESRLVIVSSTAVDNPTANGASYAAAKSACETWVAAVADGYRRAQSGSAKHPVPQRAAAVRFVITAFVSPELRAANPARLYNNFTEVSVFADAVVDLWKLPAGEINGTRIPLTPKL